MNTNEKVPFRLIDIDTEQFAILQDNIEIDDNLEFNIEVGFALSKEDCVIKVSMKSTAVKVSKPILILQVGCFFKIEEKTFEGLRSIEGEYVFPIGLIRHLCVLTTGTLRGVQHAKLEGQKSAISKLILPTINVNQLVSEDIVFKEED